MQIWQISTSTLQVKEEKGYGGEELYSCVYVFKQCHNYYPVLGVEGSAVT